MENQDSGSDVTGVSAVDAQGSSQQSTDQLDPIKNLKAEMNRKLSKINETVSQTVAQAVREAMQGQVRNPVVETEVPDYKRYVDSRFELSEKDKVEQAQKESWSQALELFPELDKDSDSFDEKFFNVANQHYGSFNLARDRDAPLKAVRLAALENGKIDQLAKEKLLKDEARRSRLISEGGAVPRDSRKESTALFDEKRLGKFGINPDKMKALLKANPDKYGKGTES